MSVVAKIPQLSATTYGEVRWNMVNQDHELIVGHLNSAMGDAIYTLIEVQYPFEQSRQIGIIPINHVLRYTTTDSKIKVGQALRRETSLRLLGQRAHSGEFSRIHLHARCDLYAQTANPVASGEYWIALTKPFAPRSERRIRDLPAELAVLELGDYPSQAMPLQDIESYRLPTPQLSQVKHEVFHINQTDVNHHVNTIIYLDIAQDRLADLVFHQGLPVARLRFRSLDVFYRKPFTAGHVYQLTLQWSRQEQAFAAAVLFHHVNDAGQPDAKIAVALRLAGVFI